MKIQPHSPGKSGPLGGGSLLVRMADLLPLPSLWVKSLNSASDPDSLDPHLRASLTPHPSAGQEARVPLADPTLRAHSSLISLLPRGLSPGSQPSLTSEPGSGLSLHQKTLILDDEIGESRLRVIIKDSRVAVSKSIRLQG